MKLDVNIGVVFSSDIANATKIIEFINQNSTKVVFVKKSIEPLWIKEGGVIKQRDERGPVD